MLGQERPKLLLCIVCCWHRRQHVQAIRDTWIKDIKGRCDYRIFYGKGGSDDLAPDEIKLDCEDAYRGLSIKVQSICRWAYDAGYEWIMKLDDDTAFISQRIVKAVRDGSVKGDYQGRVLGATDVHHVQSYCRGGCGYWLSRRAMKILADAPTPNPDDPSEFGEDSWVSKTLRKNGIEPVDDQRLRCSDSGYHWKAECPTQHNSYITLCEFLGDKQRMVHEEWVRSCETREIVMDKLRVK